MTVCKQRPQSPSARQDRDQKRSAAANGSKEIEHALNDGAQVEPLSQSKVRHSECVQGTRIEKGKGRMPIGTKHTALCSADVHSNQTDVARASKQRQPHRTRE